MDRIELVKSELNRRIADCEAQHPPIMQAEEWNDHQNEIYCEECAYRGMLKFVDSLPAETASPELEEELVNYFGAMPDDKDKIAIARHFAGWQYQKDRRKFALLKAREWHDGFNACREQMMKEAVPFYEILKAVPPTEDRNKFKLIILKLDE